MKQPNQSRSASSVTTLLLCLLLAVPPQAFSQIVKPLSEQLGTQSVLIELKWVDMPLDAVLDEYAKLTGRTIIKAPGVPAALVTLRANGKLSETEYLTAIESILAMQGVALVPLGSRFLKVVPIADVPKDGKETKFDTMDVDDPIGDTDELERRVITLKYVTYPEIQPIIDTMRHAYAQIQPLERANGFIIVDAASSIRRILEIIEYLDKPFQIGVETRIYELQHAEAGQVVGRLNELIQSSEQDPKQRGRPQTQQRAPSPGQRAVQRAGSAANAAAAAAAQAAISSGQSAQDLAERGIIQGEVRMVADERTNILIIISEPVNFSFFDKIVTILDKPVDPAITVEVVPLEYAEAEEISSVLNEFVGAATQSSDTASPSGTGATTQQGGDARSTALQDFIARRQAAQRTKERRESTTTRALTENISTLSPDTRILADDRTNSLLLMGQSSDIEILKQVIDQLDVMLSQVMIETIIIEVQLSDDLAFGIDWLQRSFTVNNEELVGPNGGVPVRQPVFSFGGSSTVSGGPPVMDGAQVTRDTEMSPGALTYFASFYDLNVDAVLQMVSSSSDAKILSTPVIATTDNTEAFILVGESRPTVTSTSVTGGGVGRNTFQYQDIVIELRVTPRINPNNFVVMEINQKADNVGGFQVIDGNNVPVITRREMEAEIAVQHRSSIVLGGLIGSEERKSRTKIPFLGDIPFLGALFRSDSTTEDRTELIFIITPYVMTTPEEILVESKRLHERSLGRTDKAWGKSWSDSPIWREETVKEVEETSPMPVLEEEYPNVDFDPEVHTPSDAVKTMAGDREKALQSIVLESPSEAGQTVIYNQSDDAEEFGVERGTVSRPLMWDEIPTLEDVSSPAVEEDPALQELVDDPPGMEELEDPIPDPSKVEVPATSQENEVEILELSDPGEAVIPPDSKLNFMDPAARSNLLNSLEESGNSVQ